MSKLLPLVLFAALSVLLLVGLNNADTKSLIPSPLIGKPAPAFFLPVLGDQQRRISNENLKGKPYLLNVWASWCYACRIEHPVIEELAAQNLLPIIGLNYKDEPQDAVAWLERFGDPYSLILSDLDGRTGIDFGVYGAPETFLVDAQGRIRYKHIGPLSPEIVNQELLPSLAQLEFANAAD